MTQGPEDKPDPWGPGAFQSGPPEPGSSLVDDLGGDRSVGVHDHPFRIDDAERYGQGPVLGWGGMGQVLAVTDRRLNREVAFKRVTLQATGQAASTRLAREAWITAHLEHPGIVPVYDAGVTDEGHLFYTMRLIRGRTLAQALTEAEELSDRTGLLRHILDACEAMAYAHSVGVVHRDLKPANVMVGSFGETQVVDWGLAAVPEARAQAGGRARGRPGGPGEETERFAGTPADMSPELARGEPVDARTDVWSLGALIYEVLTGAPPHLGHDTEALLTRARRGRIDPVLQREPAAPPELAAIAERALSPDPADRYDNAEALARELARWFEGRQVHAYTYTPVDLLRRFVIAWRAPLLVGATAILALGALGAWSWNRTVAERNRAQQAESAALDALSRADEALSRALVERAWVHADAGSRPEAEVLAVRSLDLRDSPEARGVLAAFAAQPRMRKLGEVLLPSCVEHVLDEHAETLACVTVDTLSLWDLPRSGQATLRWQVHLPAVEDVLLPPDARVLAAWSDRQLQFLDAQSGQVLATQADQQTDDSLHFQVSSGGSTPVGAKDDRLGLVDLEAMRLTVHDHLCGSKDILAGAIRRPSGRTIAMCRNTGMLIWDGDLDAEPRTLDTQFTGHHSIASFAWMPDGRRVVVGSIRGGVGIRDLTTGHEPPLTEGDGGAVLQVAPSPDGSWVAVVTEQVGVQLWDPDTGTFVGRLPSGTSQAARWTAQGELVTRSRDRLERWEVPDGAGPVRYAFDVGLAGVEPSPDGATLAVARADHSIELRDVATGRRLLLDGDTPDVGVCKRTAWHPTGEFALGTCMRDEEIRLFRAGTWERLDGLPSGQACRILVLRPDLLVSLPYSTRGPVLVRMDTGEILPSIADGDFVDASPSRSRELAVLLQRSGDVHLLRAGERPTRTHLLTDLRAGSVAVDDAGERIAILRDSDIRVVDARGQDLLILPHDFAQPTDVLLTGDGRRVLTGARDGVVRIWDVPSGRLVARLQAHDERVATLSLADDEATLFTASWDGTVRRWGLDVLDAPVPALVREVTQAWDLELDEALTGE